MAKILFDEFYQDQRRVVEQLGEYIIASGVTINKISREMDITSPTLDRILKGNNRMFLSTWCKLKRFMADKT